MSMNQLSFKCSYFMLECPVPGSPCLPFPQSLHVHMALATRSLQGQQHTAPTLQEDHLRGARADGFSGSHDHCGGKPQ